MTKHKGKTGLIDVKELLQRDEDFLRAALQALAQAALEAEMTETIGAAKGERTEARLAYRSGYYSRSLITRVGTLELRVPQDRDGRFSTELFQRYQRSEKALVGTPGRDVRAGCVDPQGQGGDRGVVRPRLLGLGDQHHQQVVGPSPEGVCRATPGGAVPVSDPGRPLRAGARGRGHPQPGGVDRGGGRWRGPAPGARRRSCQPGEPDELARFSVGDQGARPVWRRVRRLRRSRRSAAGDPRGPVWCSLAALLRAFPQKRPRPSATQARRRLPAGAALDKQGFLAPSRAHTRASRQLNNFSGLRASGLANWLFRAAK